MARALVFSHNKGNHVGFTKLLFRRKFIHCTMVLPYPLSVSFHLQTTYKKVKNLQISAKKLVGKVLINLLHHTKLVTSCSQLLA